MSKKKLEKILKFEPLKAEGERFVPYCDLGWHQGLIRGDYYRVCEQRACRHYYKFKIK